MQWTLDSAHMFMQSSLVMMTSKESPSVHNIEGTRNRIHRRYFVFTEWGRHSTRYNRPATRRAWLGLDNLMNLTSDETNREKKGWPLYIACSCYSSQILDEKAFTSGSARRLYLGSGTSLEEGLIQRQGKI